MLEKIRLTVYDIDPEIVIAPKEEGKVDIIVKTSLHASVGVAAGFLSLCVFAPPIAAAVGVAGAVTGASYSLFSSKKKTDSAESQNIAAAPAASQDNTATGERLEHFRLMKFKIGLSNNDYELAMKQVLKATDVGILDDMIKQLQAKKLTFISRVHSRFDGEIPKGVKDLEKALVDKLTLMNEAAQLIKPTQPM